MCYGQAPHGFPLLVNHGLRDVGHDINCDVIGMGHVLYEVRHRGAVAGVHVLPQCARRK